MIRRALIGTLLAAAGAAQPAAAAAPALDVLVVGRADRVLAHEERLRPRRPAVRVGSRRCRVHPATPLGALAATGLRVRAQDQGICGRRARNAGTIYVTRIGRDRAFGRQGWVYKVGRRAGTTAAGDLSGPFGTGRRLRSGDRVTWFWCVLGAGGGCQRTLAAVPGARSVRPGEALTVRVRAYDDNGKGVAAAGATVTLGPLQATAGEDGVAVFPSVPKGRHRLAATSPGLVRSFPERVVAR